MSHLARKCDAAAGFLCWARLPLREAGMIVTASDASTAERSAFHTGRETTATGRFTSWVSAFLQRVTANSVNSSRVDKVPMLALHTGKVQSPPQGGKSPGSAQSCSG